MRAVCQRFVVVASLPPLPNTPPLIRVFCYVDQSPSPFLFSTLIFFFSPFPYQSIPPLRFLQLPFSLLSRNGITTFFLYFYFNLLHRFRTPFPLPEPFFNYLPPRPPPPNWRRPRLYIATPFLTHFFLVSSFLQLMRSSLFPRLSLLHTILPPPPTMRNPLTFCPWYFSTYCLSPFSFSDLYVTRESPFHLSLYPFTFHILLISRKSLNPSRLPTLLFAPKVYFLPLSSAVFSC